jgi:hypothetical protein
MEEAEYTALTEAVEQAGFFTTLHPLGDALVLASRRTEGRLRGNSFWVPLRAGHWYLATWSPAFYLVPNGADMTALCLDCLRASPEASAEVPPDIASRYQLLEVSEEDYGQGDSGGRKA